jgi:endoglucanase
MGRWGKSTRYLAVLSSAAWIVACAADEGDALKLAPGEGANIDRTGDGVDAGSGKLPEPTAPTRPSPAHPSDAGKDPGADTGSKGPGGETGGKDTGGGSGTNDASPPSPTCADCPLTVRYKTPTAGAEKNLRPHFDIYNNGTSPQPLTELTVRYWFTSEGSNSLAYECDYAQFGCSNTKSSFGTVAGKATADHYFELSFTGGPPIPAGGHSGEIQARVHDTGFAVTFTQANDYSFDGTKGSFAEWSHVTIYRNGTLVFGVEP